MYHGSNNGSFSFFPGICFTSSEFAAAVYGDNVTSVRIDRDALAVQTIDMTAAELRDAIDAQEWPCDRQRDIDAAIAAGFNAVAYTDCDAAGQTHDCLRLLTSAGFDAAVSVT